MVEPYGKLPLRFEANTGQTDAEIQYLTRSRDYNLFLTPTGAFIAFATLATQDVRQPPGADAPLSQSANAVTVATSRRVVRMKLVGSNREARPRGVTELPGKVNYFIGNNPKKWHTNIPTYSKVQYEDLYPGVDLVYYGSEGQLEFDFVVAPGADPDAIRLTFEGVDQIEKDARGNLVLQAPDGQLRLRKPVIYQASEGGKSEIDGEFVVEDGSKVGFSVGAYDPMQPLVIDPVLSYSTYLGGSGDEFGGLVVDPSGEAYIVGTTSSVDFPVTAAAVQGSMSGGMRDVFISKLNASGTALIFSTYLGGTSSDEAHDIAIDAAGNVYVTGTTSSGDFPTTAEALQTAYGGGLFDVFVTKLGPTGSALLYSTYLGTSEGEQGFAIAVDIAGNTYVTGTTFASNFPTTPGAFQTRKAFANDVFVTKLNPTGSDLVFSTFLGGSGNEDASSVAVDASGNVYLTGGTDSTDFPTSPAAFQTVKGAGEREDAFVTKLNADGSDVVYSTYLGGGDAEGGSDIAIDTVGNAHITGITFSLDFPTTPGAIQTSKGGKSDVFVTKLNPDGGALVYSTFLGGANGDAGSSIALDSSGNAHVTGSTGSANFPTTADAFQKLLRRSDAFVTKLTPDGAALGYSTLLGGGDNDSGSSIATDSLGNAYVLGSTLSDDFLTTPDVLQGSLAGGISGDLFIAKIVEGTPTPQPLIAKGGVVNVASFAPVGLPNSAIAQGSMFTIFGDSLGPDVLQTVSSFPLPTELGGTSVEVTVDGVTVDCIMVFTSALQVAAILPSGTPTGQGEVRVSFKGESSAPEPIHITQSSFGMFTVDQTGGGIAVAQNFISQTEQPLNDLIQAANPGQVVTLWGTGLGPVEGDEAAGPLPGDLDVETEILVGGIAARILYKGRSGCCAGVDQIVIEIPEGVLGCLVPVAVKTNSVVSPYTVISIAEEGAVCSDPHGFSTAEVRTLFSGQPLRVGSVLLRQYVNEASPEDSFEDAQGLFVEYSPDDISGFALAAALLNLVPLSLETCFVATLLFGGIPLLEPEPLDAGPSLLVRGPEGEKQLVNDAPGSYFAVITEQPPGMRKRFLVPGTYTVTGSGGADVGPFSATLEFPRFLIWTNKDSIDEIPRDQPLTLTWDSANPASELVQITGGSFHSSLPVGASFTCVARASTGSFTIPAEVLSSLPQNEPGGFPPSGLGIHGLPRPARFSAAGLDIANFSYFVFASGKAVRYR